MKVNLEDLRALPQKRLQISFKEPSETVEVVKPVLGDLTVTAGAAGARLFGKIQTLLKLICHSCLRQFFQALVVDIDESFVYEDYLNEGHQETKDKELLKKDFVESVPYSGFIDISDVVYQAVVLAIPTYCSCGPECPGLTMTEAVNPDGSTKDSARAKNGDNAKDEAKSSKALDPRWQNLKKLLPNEGDI